MKLQFPPALAASFSVTGWGWLVCGGFASFLALLTRLAIPLAPPLSQPHQHHAMVPAQRRAVSGPQRSPGGWPAFGAGRMHSGWRTAPVLLQVTSWLEPIPGRSLLAPTEGDRPSLALKTSVFVPPRVLSAPSPGCQEPQLVQPNHPRLQFAPTGGPCAHRLPRA